MGADVISNEQKAILHIAKQQLSLNREMYEAILYGAAGVRSSVDLDNAGFDKVMSRLEELGFENRAKKKPARRRSRPQDGITPAQQQLIRELYQELGWDDVARHVGFNKHQVKKPWPQTRAEANKVIEGLKAIKRKAAL